MGAARPESGGDMRETAVESTDGFLLSCVCARVCVWNLCIFNNSFLCVVQIVK